MRTFVLLCIAVLSGCVVSAQGATHDQLLNRASFDLQCPREQLAVTPIDNRAAGVRGCGQQATYVESCERGAGACTWVMNTAPRR